MVTVYECEKNNCDTNNQIYNLVVLMWYLVCLNKLDNIQKII